MISRSLSGSSRGADLLLAGKVTKDVPAGSVMVCAGSVTTLVTRLVIGSSGGAVTVIGGRVTTEGDCKAQY